MPIEKRATLATLVVEAGAQAEVLSHKLLDQNLTSKTPLIVFTLAFNLTNL